MAKDKFTTKRVIDAIRKANGVKTVTAKILGCNRRTVTKYIEKYPTVRTAYLEEVGKVYDGAQIAMVDLINGHHWPAVRYAMDYFNPEDVEARILRKIGEEGEGEELVHEEQVVDDKGKTAVTLRIVRDR